MTLSSASSGSAPWVARWPPTFSRPDIKSWCTTCTGNRPVIICRRAPDGGVRRARRPGEVERVALGADGLIEGVKQGAVYFDLSTNAQGVVKKIHEVFAANGA